MSAATESPTTTTDPRTLFAQGEHLAALEAAIAETDRWHKEYARAVEVRLRGDGCIEAETVGAIWRLAQYYANSDMVPDHFKGKPNNCFVAIQLAIRLQCDVFMLMQNMYIVHGRPGLEAKFAIAMVNQRGPFSDRIKYRLEGQGKDRKCTAFAHDAKTGEVVEQTVTRAMADAEGWTADKRTKTGDVLKSKWNTLGDLMLCYRAAMFLIRLTCPEVLMGMSTKDELEDISRDAPLPDRVDLPSLSKAEMIAAELDAARAGNGHGQALGSLERPDEPSPEDLDRPRDLSGNEGAEVANRVAAAEASPGPTAEDQDLQVKGYLGLIEDCTANSKLDAIDQEWRADALVTTGPGAEARCKTLLEAVQVRRAAITLAGRKAVGR